jgi:hypothetical protein
VVRCGTIQQWVHVHRVILELLELFDYCGPVRTKNKMVRTNKQTNTYSVCYTRVPHSAYLLESVGLPTYQARHYHHNKLIHISFNVKIYLNPFCTASIDISYIFSSVPTSFYIVCYIVFTRKNQHQLSHTRVEIKEAKIRWNFP